MVKTKKHSAVIGIVVLMTDESLYYKQPDSDDNPLRIIFVNKNQLRIATLSLLILSIGLYFYTDNQQKYYDFYAKPAAKEILKDISSWQEDALLKHLSKEARNTLNDQQLLQLLNHYRQFGELQSLQELQFSRLASALSVFGSKRINYQTTAIFTNGEANVNLTLISEDEQYKIYNLTIR
jgi:hypothetical protein